MNASQLEDVLRAGTSPHQSPPGEICFKVPVKCALMTDAIVRLLPLFNQLDHCTRRVILDFENDDSELLGYLNRIGFFDHLSPQIEVLPSRPQYSGASLYGGMNRGVVEIARIDKDARDGGLLQRLTGAIATACSNRRDVAELEGAAWTIFAELIDNVFSHSQTPIDGFAALQVYKKGNCLKVAVSDSGLGLLETLRPTLRVEHPKFAGLSDMELLVEVFRQGLSRHGSARGCGLKGSAQKAIKFKADLDVRLPSVRVLLVAGRDGYAPNTALCYRNLPLIWGTHLCFTFKLD